MYAMACLHFVDLLEFISMFYTGFNILANSIPHMWQYSPSHWQRDVIDRMTVLTVLV
jgi:hypothetical protein